MKLAGNATLPKNRIHVAGKENLWEGWVRVLLPYESGNIGKHIARQRQ